ncbi:hypothetical protein PTKIN_Ptkin02bG0235400 [Pterospermum kingtungense]
MGILSDANFLMKDDFTGNCLLWNPSSGEHKLLPPTCLGKESHPAVAECSFYCSGFGFDPKSIDYKVVRFLQNQFEDGPKLEFEDGPELESEDGPELAVEFLAADHEVWGDHDVQLIEFDGSLAAVSYGTDMPFDIWVWNGDTKELKAFGIPNYNCRATMQLIHYVESSVQLMVKVRILKTKRYGEIIRKGKGKIML